MRKNREDKIVDLLKKEYGREEAYLFLTEGRQVMSGRVPDIVSIIDMVIKQLIDQGVEEDFLKRSLELPFKSETEIIEEAKQAMDKMLKELEGISNGNSKSKE